MKRNTTKNRGTILRFITIVLLGITLKAHPVNATSYLSVEPIPSVDVVGPQNLDTIQSAGYSNLELWSNRLLDECQTVQRVINELTADQAISTINAANTSVAVAAGGFEGVTNPSFVFTVQDSGADAASEADVNLLSNALGYVLSQDGTAHFSPDNPKAYAFSLDFAVVTFAGTLAGVDAKAFFEHLGTIDADLWSGLFAGFTQIAFHESPSNNSMLFLKPAVSKRRLIDGLSEAVTTLDATYVTLNNNGRPTTAKAGIAFPGNDWAASRDGAEYLSQLGERSPQTLAELDTFRQLHLAAVADLVAAIKIGALNTYLTSGFTCPTPDDN